MYLWIIGARGFLGQSLASLLKKKNLSYAASAHADADITNLDALRAYAQTLPRITHIINCAAQTHVDAAEQKPDYAYAINATGAANVGKIALEYRAHLTHISTDYVFGGDINRHTPYQETDPAAPINVYGESKLLGEKLLQKISQDNLLIIRTAWLFGSGGSHFVNKTIHLLKEGKTVHAAYDQIGSPTFVPDLCEALLQLLPHTGLFHLCNEGAASRYECALAIQECTQLHSTIEAVPASYFSAPAKRPAYSSLDIHKAGPLLSYGLLRPWRTALKEFLYAAY